MLQYDKKYYDRDRLTIFFKDIVPSALIKGSSVYQGKTQKF